jgi:hypothetical protein
MRGRLVTDIEGIVNVPRRSRRLHPEIRQEEKYVDWVKHIGGEAIKLSMRGPYGTVGWNDRLILLPIKLTIFFEFKREGEEPKDIQKARHRSLRRMKHHTYVVYTFEEAQKITKALLLAKAISTACNKLWSKPAGRSILSRAGIRKDFDHSVHVQDTKGTRRHR